MNLLDIEIIYRQHSIYISNFKSILSITSNEVLVLNDKKVITIKGSDIVATKILGKEILLNGNFKGIDFNE